MKSGWRYTIACLAYMHGAPIRRRHLLACIEGSDIEKGVLLSSHLRDVLVKWKDHPDFLCPRHRVIARQVIAEAATHDLKMTAALTYLAKIATEVTPQAISQRMPEYLAYRGIINFDNVHFLFGDNYDSVGMFYREVRIHYESDFLFWLQSGRAENLF